MMKRTQPGSDVFVTHCAQTDPAVSRQKYTTVKTGRTKIGNLELMIHGYPHCCNENGHFEAITRLEW
jgi:hypothetical protein